MTGLRVVRVPSLKACDERAQRLAHHAFDGVVGCERLEIANRRRAQVHRRGRGAMARREPAHQPCVAHLVACRSTCPPSERTRRAQPTERVRERAESRDRGRLEVRDTREEVTQRVGGGDRLGRREPARPSAGAAGAERAQHGDASVRDTAVDAGRRVGMALERPEAWAQVLAVAEREVAAGVVGLVAGGQTARVAHVGVAFRAGIGVGDGRVGEVGRTQVASVGRVRRCRRARAAAERGRCRNGIKQDAPERPAEIGVSVHAAWLMLG